MAGSKCRPGGRLMLIIGGKGQYRMPVRTCRERDVKRTIANMKRSSFYKRTALWATPLGPLVKGRL